MAQLSTEASSREAAFDAAAKGVAQAAAAADADQAAERQVAQMREAELAAQLREAKERLERSAAAAGRPDSGAAHVAILAKSGWASGHWARSSLMSMSTQPSSHSDDERNS